MYKEYASHFIKASMMFLILEKVSSLQLKDVLSVIKPHKHDSQAYTPKTSFYDKYLVFIDNPKMNENNLNNVKDGNEYYIVLIEDVNEIKRRFTDVKEQREAMKRTKLLKSQQEKKVKEITDFMADHYLTTNYLYEEVQRIKRQRMVRDDLREMVEYLEKPEKKKMKAQVMKCYREARKSERIPVDEWRHDTNNLVINLIRDPHNYGYIN